LELSAGSDYIPREVQGFVNNVARGVAILLALLVFLVVRRFGGMKSAAAVWRRFCASDYCVPLRRSISDRDRPLAAFSCSLSRSGFDLGGNGFTGGNSLPRAFPELVDAEVW
jgi:hypothetical protein